MDPRIATALLPVMLLASCDKPGSPTGPGANRIDLASVNASATRALLEIGSPKVCAQKDVQTAVSGLISEMLPTTTATRSSFSYTLSTLDTFDKSTGAAQGSTNASLGEGEKAFTRLVYTIQPWPRLVNSLCVSCQQRS